MIKMFNNDKKISLSELIDIDYLQKIQDEFADIIGVAVVTVDENGPITKPINFSVFCDKIRASEIGFQKCFKSEMDCQNLAIEKKEPVICTCHAGLTCFVIPIIVDGKYIASIVAGQILTKKIDEEHFINLAKQLGIILDDEYLESLKTIKVLPDDGLQMAVRLLSTFANSICMIAYKNYQLIKKNQREKLNDEIVKKIRSTLDAEEIKKYFVEITQKYFDADRCVFADFDSNTNKFLPIKYEKLKSEDIKTLINIDVEEKIPEFCVKLKKGKDIIVRDSSKTALMKNISEYISIKNMISIDIKSDYGLLVKCKNRIVGVLVIHFINEKKVLTNDELNFLKLIREHAGTALCQAELYSKTEQQTKREKLHRQITETIRKSLDFNKTKLAIVENIGKTLNADRCFVTEYDKFSDSFLIVNEEYLSSDSLVSFKGIDLNKSYFFLNSELKKGKVLIMDETGIKVGDEKFDINDVRFSAEKNDREKYNIKTLLIFPLFYREEFLGNLVLHSIKLKHKIGVDEIDFLNLISDQIALAMHQAKMYKRIQLQAEREKISRNIIEIMRSTLDKNIIKKLFVRNVGKFFSADRVFMCNYNSKTKAILSVDENSEFLLNKDLKSFVGIDWMTDPYRVHIQKLIEKRELLIPSMDEYKKNAELNGNPINLTELGDIKSVYCFPVTYQDKLTGTLNIIFTTKEVELSIEEINRIRSICTQAGIALYHADLYLQAQEALQMKNNIINEVKNGVEPAVHVIVNDLDNVIKSCHELLQLTKDISKDNND